MQPQMIPQMQAQQPVDFNSATVFTTEANPSRKTEDGDDYTDEEMALMAQVELENKERQ
jgi:hypothetical protein